MGCVGLLRWVALRCVGWALAELTCLVLVWIVLGCIEFCFVALRCLGLRWVALDWATFGCCVLCCRVVLGSGGSGWVLGRVAPGLCWVRFCWIGLRGVMFNCVVRLGCAGLR